VTARHLLLAGILILVLSPGLAGCGLFGGDGGENGCGTLQVSARQNEPLSVIYSVEVSGQASVSQVTYQTDSGEQQVANPTQRESPEDAWSTSADLSSETQAVASAEATAQDGTVTLRLEAFREGTQIEKEEACGTQRQ